MMENIPLFEQIKKATDPDFWDFGNKVLYDLCEDNFYHKNPDIIAAKVLFIGRIYAAAVERRKNKSQQINDDFYFDTIVPVLMDSELDDRLYQLKVNRKISHDNIKSILETHYYLTQLLYEITRLNKRSFSSKYLHFHLPDLFFIYDSRVVKALRYFISSVPKDSRYPNITETIDKEYGLFFIKCFHLKRSIEDHYRIKITNRQLDNLLIQKANQINR